MKKIYQTKSLLIVSVLFLLTSCESYLDVLPNEKIVENEFWTTESDVELALNGVYNSLRNNFVFGYGGGYDACTPDAYQWAHWEGKQQQVGDGTITSGTGGIVNDRWKFCYQGIARANYFLANIDRAKINEEKAKIVKGEVHFLRAVYYYVLVKSYGGVPIVLQPITPAESRQVTRASEADVWKLVDTEFDLAIKLLPEKASKNGKADKGAAFGMKMKANLYQNKYSEVLRLCDSIDILNRYQLFPSYYGLFQFDNEGNKETVFALSFMAGTFEQGSVFDRYWQPQNLKYGIDGSNSVAPTQILVDAYETLDGSPIDPTNPYVNRDPRLDFTVLRPGAYFQGQAYPKEIKNHTGQKVGFGIRKYTIENMAVKGNESPLDFMILRYADVLLCRAEGLIETNTDINKAIMLINSIRTERTDVKLPAIPLGLSQAAARKALRHERRIELALEGQYWDDIKRWNIGPDLYPALVVSGLSTPTKIDTLSVKFKLPQVYDIKRDNYLPIPDSERSLNPKLEQNYGY